MSEPRHLHGTVELVLDDRTYKLRPTMDAADRIDREFGGIGPALERVRAMSVGAIANLVIIGVGTTSKGGKEKLKELVWQEGVAAVAPAVVEFLLGLLDPSGKQADADDAEPDPKND